jgi:hypothetical protein
MTLEQYWGIGFGLIILLGMIQVIAIGRYLSRYKIEVKYSGISSWDRGLSANLSAYKKTRLLRGQSLFWWYISWVFYIAGIFWVVSWFVMVYKHP